MGATIEKTRELIKEINEIKKNLEDLKNNSKLSKENDPSKEEDNLWGKIYHRKNFVFFTKNKENSLNFIDS